MAKTVELLLFTLLHSFVIRSLQLPACSYTHFPNRTMRTEHPFSKLNNHNVILNAAIGLLLHVQRFDHDLRAKATDQLHWLCIMERVMLQLRTLVCIKAVTRFGLLLLLVLYTVLTCQHLGTVGRFASLGLGPFSGF